MWHDMRQRGRMVTAIDMTAALHLPGGERPSGVCGPEVLREQPVGPIVLHLNPPLYGLAYGMLPRRLRLRSRLIAFWAWELDRMPGDWLLHAKFAEEFWVPSEFVAAALRRLLGPACGSPIHVVPHAVDAMPFGPRRSAELAGAARARHGLPPAAFIAGYSFAMGSNWARKNPLAAVQAFGRAFPPGGRPARLLLRCYDGEVWPAGFAALAAAAAQDPRILLFDGERRRIPLVDLYHAIDVYLSLHRSEGYGLNLAEAASLGTPVLATGWGLAADIAARAEVRSVGWRLVPVVDPQGAYTELGALWAEPDLDEAVAALRALADGRTGPRMDNVALSSQGHAGVQRW
jgi:glycosyltransferase involved in cell wall biosynthesis